MMDYWYEQIASALEVYNQMLSFSNQLKGLLVDKDDSLDFGVWEQVWAIVEGDGLAGDEEIL